MLLRNRRFPFNVVEEPNQGLINWLKEHDYEEIEAAPTLTPDTGKRGKDKPPVDDVPTGDAE